MAACNMKKKMFGCERRSIRKVVIMNFKILSSETLSKVYKFSMRMITFSHDRYDGSNTGEYGRVVFDRGDSVCILLYDRADQTFIMTEQFRIGVAVNPGGDSPWVLETVAGSMDGGPGETPLDTAMREVEEEAPGCKVLHVMPMPSFYNSPGGSSEKTHMFCAVIDSSGVAENGGLAEHNEDIKVVKIPVQQAYRDLDEGRINTSSAMIAIMWFRLNERSMDV